MKTPHDTVSIPRHVCTIKDPRLAKGVLIALVGVSIAAAVWLLSAMLAGPWLADTLLVESAVAAIMVLAAGLMAWSLSRPLGCGRCHTPQCVHVT
jgi:hypothetical protein